MPRISGERIIFTNRNYKVAKQMAFDLKKEYKKFYMPKDKMEVMR